MISAQTVELAMRESNPQATIEEITQLWQLMLDEVGDLKDQIAWKMRKQWVQEHGRHPDGPTWGMILDRARLDAEEIIIATYLEPLLNPEDEEEDIPHYQALNDPQGWKTRFYDIQASKEAREVVAKLWIEEPVTFRVVALALMEHRLHRGLEIPYSRKHPEYQNLVNMIQQAVLELDN